MSFLLWVKSIFLSFFLLGADKVLSNRKEHKMGATFFFFNGDWWDQASPIMERAEKSIDSLS